ncbi:MAG TPA: NUDIX hydrolase [Lentimicrobium sp.]|nr:NUDIX hydrolase [Lentimicrobium sp.]
MSYTYEYPRPAVTVDAIILRHHEKNTEILLIKRLHPPFEGMWAIPGGFINLDETLEEAAARELEEETGLKGIKLEQFGIFDEPDRDPRQRTIAIVFLGFLNDNSKNPAAADDASECRWFDINSIPELAFDHNKILGEAIKYAQTRNMLY